MYLLIEKIVDKTLAPKKSNTYLSSFENVKERVLDLILSIIKTKKAVEPRIYTKIIFGNSNSSFVPLKKRIGVTKASAHSKAFVDTNFTTIVRS